MWMNVINMCYIKLYPISKILISHNSSYFRCCNIEITKCLCQLHDNKIFNHNSLSLVIYKQFFFFFMLLQKCFFFKKIYRTFDKCMFLITYRPNY